MSELLVGNAQPYSERINRWQRLLQSLPFSANKRSCENVFLLLKKGIHMKNNLRIYRQKTVRSTDRKIGSEKMRRLCIAIKSIMATQHRWLREQMILNCWRGCVRNIRIHSWITNELRAIVEKKKL